jgi:hypothetical protein
MKEEQRGLRKGYSTMHRMFILSELIEKYRSGKKCVIFYIFGLKKSV